MNEGHILFSIELITHTYIYIHKASSQLIFWSFHLVLYCIVLYLLPVLNPKSYDGARISFHLHYFDVQ